MSKANLQITRIGAQCRHPFISPVLGEAACEMTFVNFILVGLRSWDWNSPTPNTVCFNSRGSWISTSCSCLLKGVQGECTRCCLLKWLYALQEMLTGFCLQLIRKRSSVERGEQRIVSYFHFIVSVYKIISKLTTVPSLPKEQQHHSVE